LNSRRAGGERLDEALPPVVTGGFLAERRTHGLGHLPTFASARQAPA